MRSVLKIMFNSKLNSKLSATLVAMAMGAVVASGAFAGSKPGAKPTPVKTVTEGVEVRKDADAKAEIIATLKKGENLTATDRKGSYWKVKLADGREGFVPVTSVQSRAGINAMKSAIGAAGTQAGDAASAVKEVVGDKVNAVKAESKPAPAAPTAPKAPEIKSKDLEKAANKLFKK